jgi:hypothetical protein
MNVREFFKAVGMRFRAGWNIKDANRLATIPVPSTWTRLKPVEELASSVWYRTDRGLIVTVTVERFSGHEWLHATLARPSKPPTQDDVVAARNIIYGGDSLALLVMPRVSDPAMTMHLYGRVDGSSPLPAKSLS